VDYTYDVLNRLTYVDFPTDTDITYTYDTGTNGVGQRTGMSDESGEYTFGYDGRGRLTSRTSVIEATTYNLARTYTPGGRVSAITYPTGRTINYSRSTCACKVDSITTTFSGTATTLMEDLTYRPFGGASGMDNGAGGTVGSTYNTSGKLTVSNPGATHERTYTYDNNGNLLTITSASTPYYDRTYVYDALNRLTSATAEDAWGIIDYTYDDAGNRLTEVTDDDSDTYAYTTGTNLLATITGTATTSYTYDANGNITGMGTKTLTYNDDNRLVSVAEAGTTLGEYTYNGLGQRIIKEAGGTTTVFLYDFDGNIIGESNASGTFSKEYLYNGSSRLAMVDVGTSAVYYYGNDQLGTPEILADSTNTVVWEAIYKPFGEAEVNTHSTVVNNFRFPGQYYDSETGLHYNYNRYYNPSTGRYLTPDPIGQAGGINIYNYVNGNPINSSDENGLFGGILDDVFINSFFVGWYFNNNGTLHLDDYFGSYLKTALKSQINSLRNQIQKLKKCDCAGCVSGTLSAHYQLIISDSMSALGGGTLFAQYNCCNGTCSIHYYIRDEFKDPVDTFNWVDNNYELPGGHPYGMYWDYYENI